MTLVMQTENIHKQADLVNWGELVLSRNNHLGVMTFDEAMP
jgi:hypothetical protein